MQITGPWPKGHSWLVLDDNPASDRVLALEANTSGSGLNGVGFGGLGPLCSTNARDWTSRVRHTWTGRAKNAREVTMARLNVDHQTARDGLFAT